jgi:hypothetical protein
MWAGQDSRRNRDGHAFVRWALLVTTWTYFSLNFSFFGYPWPWKGAAGWFTSGLIYAVSLFGLTALVWMSSNWKQRATDELLRILFSRESALTLGDGLRQSIWND